MVWVRARIGDCIFFGSRFRFSIFARGPVNFDFDSIHDYFDFEIDFLPGEDAWLKFLKKVRKWYPEGFHCKCIQIHRAHHQQPPGRLVLSMVSVCQDLKSISKQRNSRAKSVFRRGFGVGWGG